MWRTCALISIALNVISSVNGVRPIDKVYAPIFDNVKSYASPEVQAKAAMEVIERTIPESAHLFEILINQSLPLNTFKLFKGDGRDMVLIEATSGVVACKGFHYYLTYYCNSHISWDGNRISSPLNIVDVNVTQTSPSRFIYYQNVCTWSYSFAWWQLADWRRHIDWMAMQGITLTLAPVQELIWDQIYTELGMTRDEIDDHLAGPGFFAWQRMGNIRGWGGPLPKQFKLFSSLLQKQVVAELNNLGIAVALPAFAGHVPVAFKRIFPNTTLTPVERWNRFPDEYCCPLFIDPIDPLFQRIGQMFLQHVINEYGSNHIYFSDPFNEINPSNNSASYLAATSKSIYDAMRSVDDKAVWLLQAWMFVKNPFWNEVQMKPFLTAVPKGHILVLDLMSEQYPQYIRTKSYYGQPFIWCMLHNFGGTLGMHGSIDSVNKEIVKAHKMKDSSMIGVGITPEGINQNYMIYDFALDRAWSQNTVNITKWIKQYAFNRYGFENVNISNAWINLSQTVYNYSGLIKIHGKYTVCRRPSVNIHQWTWYNLTIVDSILENFLNVSNEFVQDNELYKHDLVDITRQMLQNKVHVIYDQLISSFYAKNLTLVKDSGEQFKDILNDLDRILGSNEHFLLGKWIQNAKSLASNELESHVFRFNALNQITTWGPNGQIVDYATKQWAGLIADYCLPRWELFIDELVYSLKEKNGKFNDSKCKAKIFRQIEEPFGVGAKEFSTQPQGNAIDLAKEIHAKWKTELIY